MPTTILGDLRTFIFLVLGFGFAIGDLWHFHAVNAETDLAILFGIFTGAGVSVAHTAGVNAASSSPPPPLPLLPPLPPPLP